MNHNGCHGHWSRQHWYNQEQTMNVPEWQRNPQGKSSHHNHRQRKISIIEAINIATAQVPGEVVQAELDHEKGMLVYEIDIVTAENVKYEVIIDANSGAIIEVKLD